MKKLCLILVVVSLSFSVKAQEGIRLGIKGSYLSTWLFNKNVSDRNASLDYASTFSTSFGAQAIMMFSETYGMSAELNYASHNQKYDGYSGNEKNTFKAEVNLSYIDVPIMFRVSSPKGPYFDIGPQFSFLSGAKETFEPDYSSTDKYTDKDVKDDFKSIGISAVLGFGIDIKLTEMLNLTTGLRFGYMFTDATNEYSAAELEAKENSGKISGIVATSHFTDKGAFDYKPTNRTYGGLQLGLQLKLGK